jgi:hypothetical protein
MRLFHTALLIGDITNVIREGVWMCGSFHPNELAVEYREFFAYMTDESRGLDEDPPFDEHMLDPNSWFIEDGNARRGIEVPAVHADGTIEWRWR